MVEYGFLCEWAVYYYYQSEWQVTEINWKTPTGLIWLIKSACSDDETQNDDALPKQRQICGSFWNLVDNDQSWPSNRHLSGLPYNCCLVIINITDYTNYQPPNHSISIITSSIILLLEFSYQSSKDNSNKMLIITGAPVTLKSKLNIMWCWFDCTIIKLTT